MQQIFAVGLYGKEGDGLVTELADERSQQRYVQDGPCRPASDVVAPCRCQGAFASQCGTIADNIQNQVILTAVPREVLLRIVNKMVSAQRAQEIEFGGVVYGRNLRTI